MGPGALETALALYQAPSLAAATRSRPVPVDVFEVIRIAAGKTEAIDVAVARSGCSATVVSEASQLYLKHVLFDPDADHYRVLGVHANADSAQMREHRRWLLKWLHPDRADEWDAVYAARVQQAWQQLRDPDRRAHYDQSLADGDDWATVTTGAALRPVWTARALAAGEGDADAPRPSRGAVWAGVSLLVIGLGWALWPTAGRQQSDTTAVSLAPPTPRDGPYVLERVPLAPAEPREHPAPRAAGTADAPPPQRVEPIRVVGADDVSSAPAPTARAAPEASAVPVADAPPTDRPPPVAAPLASVASPPTPDRIDADAVAATMAAFQAAYERGDIEALMGVFTDDAQNRRGGREAIRQDYTRLFRSSRQRRLQWHSLDWQQGSHHAVGEGGFVASITPRRGVTNTVRGRVRVEVVQQGQQVHIRELWHEDGVP